MADDLKRVGLVFKADGTVDFKKSLSEINSAIQENRSEFKLAESQWDENTKAADKLRDRQKYLAQQTKEYSDKVKLLEKELEELEKAEQRDENAIHKKRIQLNQARTSLNNYEKGLNGVEQELKSGVQKLKEYTQKLEDFGEKAKGAGDKLNGVSTASAGVLAGAAALVPATEDYRKVMASLEVSSEMAGYTAEQTKETYTQLFGILGDDQSAATTTANLQALGLTQEQLKEITNGTIGAWAKYGDSIPIDGLAESINETVKAGSVTGTFADVLNWAGSSEEDFNKKLEACKNETERVNLVMQELSSQGLVQAGEKWRENNKDIVDNNEATAKMKEETAELAETLAPLIANVTELAAGLLSKFNDLSPSTQALIGGGLALIAVLSSIFSVIGTVSTGIASMTALLGPATAGTTGFNLALSANPIGLVVTALAGLIALFATLYNKCEWFRNGVNRIWGGIKSFLNGIKDWLKGVFNFEWKLPKIKLPHIKIKGKFSLSPPSTPKFSIDWYAKGGILNSPTIFGLNGDHFMGGGEAGPEAILPIALLKKYIREENGANNAVLARMIKEAIAELSITAENNIYIGDKRFFEVITNMVLKKISNNISDKRVVKGLG